MSAREVKCPQLRVGSVSLGSRGIFSGQLTEDPTHDKCLQMILFVAGVRPSKCMDNGAGSAGGASCVARTEQFWTLGGVKYFILKRQKFRN